MLHHISKQDILNCVSSFLTLFDILNITSTNTTLRKRLPLIPLDLSLLCINTSRLKTIPRSFYVKKLITILDVDAELFTIPASIIFKLDSLTLGRSMSLTKINKYNMHLVDISCLSKCSKLTYLELDNTVILYELSMIAKCTNLVTLSLGNCSLLDNFSYLPASLRSVTLRRAYCIPDLSLLTNCTQLVQLTIDQCYYLTDVSLLSKFTELESITIKFGNILVDISLLWQCTKLKKVVFENCPLLVSTLPKNITYDIFDCPGLGDNT